MPATVTDRQRQIIVDLTLLKIGEGLTQSSATRYAAEQYAVSTSSIRRWAKAQGRPLARATLDKNRAQVRSAVRSGRVYGLTRQRELVNELMAEVDAHLTDMAIQIVKAGGRRTPEIAVQLSRTSVVLARAIAADRSLDQRGAALLAPEARPELGPSPTADPRIIDQDAASELARLDTLDDELRHAGLDPPPPPLTVPYHPQLEASEAMPGSSEDPHDEHQHHATGTSSDAPNDADLLQDVGALGDQHIAGALKLGLVVREALKGGAREAAQAVEGLEPAD